jgi:hypothetical protein
MPSRACWQARTQQEVIRDEECHRLFPARANVLQPAHPRLAEQLGPTNNVNVSAKEKTKSAEVGGCQMKVTFGYSEMLP